MSAAAIFGTAAAVVGAVAVQAVALETVVASSDIILESLKFLGAAAFAIGKVVSIVETLLVALGSSL